MRGSENSRTMTDGQKRGVGLLLLVVGFFVVTWLLIHNAATVTGGHRHWGPSSPGYAVFGFLGVVALWVVSWVLTGELNIFALAMGADNRLSTSKLQVLLWTATVGFVYVTLYADRSISLHLSYPLFGIPQNVLIALGISVTSAVAAQAITGSQVAANPDTKDTKPEPSYDPKALVANDDSSTPSLTKVQVLFWTVVAIVVYLVATFKGLGSLATCIPNPSAKPPVDCMLPDIDTVLMVFMGLGHATYLGNKIAGGPQPLLAGAAASQPDAAGKRTVTLTGTNLGSAGTISMNGSTITPANLTWGPTAITFDIPPRAGGGPWTKGDTAAFTIAINGSTSASVTLTIA